MLPLLKDKLSQISSTILISPPQKYFDFNWRGLEDAVEIMICGDCDPFCDVDDLREKAEYIHSKLTILQATDHFYTGQEAQLAKHLRKYIHEKKLDFNENGVMVGANVIR